MFTRRHRVPCAFGGDDDDDVGDPYAVLGVRAGADVQEVRRAYRRRARELHPDVCDAPDAAEQFRRRRVSSSGGSDGGSGKSGGSRKWWLVGIKTAC